MRAWLHERNVTLEERDFFRDPFSDAELRALIVSAHPEPVEGHERNNEALPTQSRAALLFSWKSPSFKPAMSKVEGALGLSPDALDSEALIRLMFSEPRLIRRPIVRIGDTLIIGPDFKALEAALR